MLRERLEASMESRSTTTILAKPSKARFFKISLPSAPAPITSTCAERSFSWFHQPMRRKRLKRSSFCTECAAPLAGDDKDLLICSLRSCGDFRLQAQNIAIFHGGIGQGLRILHLAA